MNKSPETHAGGTTAAGLAILLAAIASITAVAFDRMASGSDPLSILQSIVRIGPWHKGVHVVAMACLGAFMYGYTVLSRRLGLHRGAVLAALIAYAAGSMLMLVATTIDGFIGIDTAALFVNKTPDAVRVGYWLVQVLENVVLADIARVAWVCQSVAALGWAWAMLGEGALARKLGMLGLVSGALPALAVFVAGDHITETVVVGILFVQASWNLIAALYLFSGTKPSQLAAQLAPAR
jgi:hypothetical protein